MTTAQAGDVGCSRSDVAVERERFARRLVGFEQRDAVAKDRPPGAPPRGPLPSISAERICEHALELVDQEGIDALTVRRLAADLKISTRTLYKRIKSRPHLIQNIGDLFASRLTTQLLPRGSWESAARQWCIDLHKELTSHPHVAELLSYRTRTQIDVDTNGLVKSAVDSGILHDDAIEFCRTLARITLNDAVPVSKSHGRAATGDTPGSAGADPEQGFIESIGLVLDGVRARMAKQRNAGRGTRTAMSRRLRTDGQAATR